MSEEFQRPLFEATSGTRAIILSEKDMADAVRLLKLVSCAREHQQPTQGACSQREEVPAINGDSLVARARRILRLRKLRNDFFVGAMFGECAWEMLLTLYCDDVFGPRHSVTSLCATVQTPATSALRWLAYLEHKGLICKTDHPTDKRSSLIDLTPEGRTSIERYLQAAHEQGP